MAPTESSRMTIKQNKNRKRFTIIFRHVVLIIGTTIVLIFFIECLSFILLKIVSYEQKDEHVVEWYEQQGFMWAKNYFKEFKASSQLEWKPYTGWRRKAFKGEYINIDQNGIRYTVNKLNNKDNDNKTINIFMFGGSTLWGTGARDDNTIPSIVAEILTKNGLNVRVTNFGETGYVNFQETIELLIQLQKNLTPDIVVFYDGINDSFAGFQSGMGGSLQNAMKRKNEFGVLENFPRLALNTLQWSPFFRLYKRLRYKGDENYLRKSEYHKVASEIADNYLSNMKLVHMIKNNKFVPVFYWHPTIFTKDKLTAYEQERYDQFKWLKAFYENLLSIIDERRSDFEKYNFYNISKIFGDNDTPIFIDYCHTNELGNQIVAQRIANDLLAIINKKMQKYHSSTIFQDSKLSRSQSRGGT